ncbi:MAG TPA: cbb3-type cytochrome c oxidase subunit I [Candidatus Thermoplasmatota archaeon]|nr:cbb3-type cytochrome c oxidase subunit I [Candidatus Thermoplasmatota archaeon]
MSEAIHPGAYHAHHGPTGWRRWLSTTNHKEVGILYLVTSLAFFIVGGVFALLMRTQLATANNDFLEPDTYNQLVTMHGLVMIFFFLSPFAFAFGNYFVPIQIGASDLIFPRLNALSYWMYLAGGVVSLLGFAFGGAAAGGWTLYTPLSNTDQNAYAEAGIHLGVDFVGMGIVLFTIGVTVSTINFLVTYFFLRAPGMKLYHMPMFSWAVFWTVVIMLFAFPAIGAAGLMLYADRQLDFHFFDVQNGGAILWAHLFWFFGHPEVYILLLPGLGAVLEVIPTFAERPLYGKKAVIWSLAIATVLSFIVYVHHMFTTGVDPNLRKAMTITTEMISIPFGVIYLCLIGTLWRGNIRFEVPMLFAIGFIILFLVGGLTGVFLSSVAIDYGMQGSYWVVAHFHYAVLGGGVWGVLAGLYFWYPKMTGRMFNDRLGRLHFWLGFIGFNLLFLSMFFFGKMPRRIYTYDDVGAEYAMGGQLSMLNMVATVGAFMFGIGVVLMLFNFVWSLRHGARAGPDPWGGEGLEWTMSSPPPPENFTRTPVLAEHPASNAAETRASDAAAVTMVAKR